MRCIAIEIYDNEIRYNGEIIWQGFARHRTMDEVNEIVENYKDGCRLVAINRLEKLKEDARSHALMALVLEYSEIIKLLGGDDATGVYTREGTSERG